MIGILHFITFISAATSACAAATTTTTATCTTKTITATFDDLPTGTLSSQRNYNGLKYSGWEVVAAKDTVFQAHSGVNILRIIGRTATIVSAQKGQYYNDLGGRHSPSFYFGCENMTDSTSTACGFQKTYHVVQQPAYDGYFNASGYPHTLELAGSIETINTRKITWGVYTDEGFNAPKELKMYIDSYRYHLSNCN